MTPTGAEGSKGRHVTWRLVVPPAWGGRLDPRWLPSNHSESWRQLFEREDLAGRVLREGGAGLAWREAAQATRLLSEVLVQYRVQLRVAEDESARCEHAPAHLAALAAAGDGAEPPSRSHPAGPWLVRAFDGRRPLVLATYPSVDGAEGDAAARRTGDATIVCWAEPDLEPAPTRRHASGELGWVPRVDAEVRRHAFAVEDTVAALCRAAAGAFTGPDVLDLSLLCRLGEAAYRSALEYRTLLAGAWTELEACPHAATHERRAEAGIRASTSPADDGPGGPWRQVLLVRGGAAAGPAEVGVHPGLASAAAAVAVSRVTDEAALHWCEPVLAGPRPRLGDQPHRSG